MDVMRYFTKIFITTRGGPADATKIVSIAVYDQAFQAYRMGYAATLTLSMLIVTIVLGIVFVRFFFGEIKE
jgi:multiple sugar transport system permease protein